MDFLEQVANVSIPQDRNNKINQMECFINLLFQEIINNSHVTPNQSKWRRKELFTKQLFIAECSHSIEHIKCNAIFVQLVSITNAFYSKVIKKKERSI